MTKRRFSRDYRHATPVDPAALKRAQESPPPPRRIVPALPSSTPRVKRSTKRR